MQKETPDLSSMIEGTGGLPGLEGISIGEVILPHHPTYEASLRRWSVTAEKRAAIIVKPANSEETSRAILFATAHSIPLTVCGGGHSSSGTSSSEGGMVIDLGLMRRVDINTTEMTVSFGGGCLWEDVERALERHGLATVGGVVNHTGVGGLTLGGGHGWLTPLYGLTIDNLVSAEMVLADGSVTRASDQDDADLFWAIRGAGAQFGIATQFVCRVHKQGHVWSGALAYSEDKLPDLVAVANELHNRASTEGHCLALGMGYAPDGRTRAVMAIPCFHGTESDARRYFSPLLSIDALVDNTTMMSVADMNTLLNPALAHGIRRLMGSSNVTMPLDVQALLETTKTFWEFCESHDGMGLSMIAIEFFPTCKIREVKQDATAYANRGAYYDAVTAFGWHDPSLDTKIRQFNREICQQIWSTNGYQPGSTKDGSIGPVGTYINIEADDIAPQAAYGINLPRLQDLKRKYDPHNVFHKWHGIGATTTTL